MSDLQKTIERNPDWPDWAKYYAKDSDGRTYVYDTQPYQHEVGWAWKGSDVNEIEVEEEPGDWKESLRSIVDPVPEKAIIGTVDAPGPYESAKVMPPNSFTGVHLASDFMGLASSEPKRNPKHIQAQKDGKCPMEYLCYSALAAEARVLKHGADKYGVRNWRIDEILASTYEGAIMRHLLAWAGGADMDPDSGESHLAHIRACCAVVLDAIDHDTLIDDRDRKESKDNA